MTGAGSYTSQAPVPRGMVTVLGVSTGLLEQVVDDFVSGIVAALPDIVAGLLFLVFAYLLIGLIQRALRSVLERLYPSDRQLIADFGVLVAGLFLWFGAALALLDIVGLGGIAASLGTAAGFVALGVSYALSNMIADTVAGIYLLRDPDFTPGDTIVVGSMTGTLLSIDLRKSRFEVENDTVVVANREVESRWARRTEADGSGDADGT